MDQSSYNYIVIEGNIGAGKTSLATMLAEDCNARLILERFADNPFLPKFYRDPKRYAFPLELSFMADRYSQLKEEAPGPDLFRAFTVADYYFMKSLVFSSKTLEQDEFTLYRQLFYIIYSSLPKPDLYVYLHVPPGKLLRNIAMRGREYERSITAEYLSGIQESYFNFFRQNPGNRYLILDMSDIDFVANHNDYLRVKEAIFATPLPEGINFRNF